MTNDNIMVRNKRYVFGEMIALEYGIAKTIRELHIFLDNGFRIVGINEINREHLKYGRSIINNRVINTL